jgi:hypothetical protein
MNIETIEIPLEEYRMLLKESKENLKITLEHYMDELSVRDNIDDKLLTLIKVNEYANHFKNVRDRLDRYEVKYTADDIPF